MQHYPHGALQMLLPDAELQPHADDHKEPQTPGPQALTVVPLSSPTTCLGNVPRLHNTCQYREVAQA